MSRHCFIIHPFLIQGVVFYLMIISNFEGNINMRFVQLLALGDH